MKIRPVAAELFHADGRMDKRSQPSLLAIFGACLTKGICWAIKSYQLYQKDYCFHVTQHKGCSLLRFLTSITEMLLTNLSALERYTH